MKKENKTPGTYSDIIFSKASNKKLDDIIKYIGFDKKDFNDDYHCTIVYSRKKLNWFKTSNGSKQDKNGEVKSKISKLVKIKSFGHFDTEDGKNLHVVIDCPLCESQFKKAEKAGMEFDYPKYTPHVTLLYDCTKDRKNFDISQIDMSKYIGEKLEVVEERITKLNKDWLKDND